MDISQKKIEKSTTSQQKSVIFNITSGIRKPRGVFIWVLNTDKFSQTENPFLYNTFSVGNNKKLNHVILKLGMEINILKVLIILKQKSQEYSEIFIGIQ